MNSFDKKFLVSIFSDFQIREANALPIAHTYTVMCVLPINLFNQVNSSRNFNVKKRNKLIFFLFFQKQIFTFLWFWFVFVIFLTLYDTFIWVYRLIFRRESYLLERLKAMDYDLTQKWPFENACRDHVSLKDLLHIQKSKRLTKDRINIYIYGYSFLSSKSR